MKHEVYTSLLHACVHIAHPKMAGGNFNLVPSEATTSVFHGAHYYMSTTFTVFT